jgi:hypothetical protein
MGDDHRLRELWRQRIQHRRFFQQVREKGAAVNVATLYGHNTVLRAVRVIRAASSIPQQMSQGQGAGSPGDGAMERWVLDGVDLYPGTYSPTEDIHRAGQGVRRSSAGSTRLTLRNEGTTILDAIDEALRIRA